MLKRFFILLFCLFLSPLFGQETTKLMQRGFAEGITIDLREPLYVDGILATEKGGVITGPHLRIQALKIRYTRQIIEGVPIYSVEAEDQLILEFGEYVFTGKKLFYNFQKQEGIVYEGKTSAEPWYFGGEKIHLLSDGSYIIHDGYVTTSENAQADWEIHAQEVYVIQKQYLKARQVQLLIMNYPILWIPSLRANLNSIFDSPLKYRFRWGGRQGPRFGLTYEVFSGECWKIFLRFDYRLTRGPGGGLELYYLSPDHKTEFESINYVAKDSSLFDLNEKIRYRFEGFYRKLMVDDKVSILFTYDKVSDIDLPSSYYDRDFYFETTKRTQLVIRRQEEDWIGNFYARVKVNHFETVKQELPTLSTQFRPFLLGNTGIVSENWAQVSYLDFKYASHLLHVDDYHSSRIEYRPKFYRPFLLGPITLTPKWGGVAILYSDSPQRNSQLLATGFVGATISTQLHRYYGNLKHVIEPYTSYHYYTYPTSSPTEHYIFDIDDGWYRLHQLTFGVKNSVYKKKEDQCISRLLFIDLYAHAFLNARALHSYIPKIYSRLYFLSLPTVRHIINLAWDFEHNQVDHFNFRSEWTLNTDFALATEFRHRGAFSWRKVDQDNFFLDAFRDEESLRHSPLSDRRDTLLLHLFYRFHPNWACELSSRQGWNRLKEPGYREFEVDLLTTIQTAWNLRLSFQHTENDNRIALYINMGLKRPEQENKELKTCYYD